MYRQDNFALPFYAGRTIPGERNLCASLCRVGSGTALAVILNDRQAEALADSGFALERELTASWSPPGRPHRVDRLILARVTPTRVCECP
jgi:hypothetical protein